ncbi:SAV_2336 N-terminal domain-related protein [Kitasatospora sp. NPDC002227]|uniref:SAV_2336 N-terminal domain-related protein n=1 Tax=Kitasatospora sp. NPDC002227 TaxID=3154773 RepID=UPI00331A3B77
MPSEPPGLDRLAALLAALGRPAPEPVELAELLWLAARGTPGEEGEPDGVDLVRRWRRRRRGFGAPDSAEETAEGAGVDGRPGRTALHLPSDDPADALGAAAPVPTPSTPMLARPLALQRALRPLKRQVPDPRRALLDETATAHRLAEALRGAAREPAQVPWLPVLRPGQERWLDLHLVLDGGPTMRLWRPLALELRSLLQQTGAFRQVTLSGLTAQGGLTDRRPVGPRTAVLVLSDCMGPQWRPGPAGERWRRGLRALARRAPVAVVQPLPERLWRLAARPVLPGLFSAPEAGAPSAAYGFSPFAEEEPGPGELAVPVLEPGAGWLANWARLVGSPGGGQVVGAALLLGPAQAGPGVAQGPEPDELAAEELLLRFRSVASREAFTLAGLTALTTPALPVMRLLQAASFARPQPQHLAEVVVSGLLKERTGHRDHFEFRPGVRELLLHTLPRSTTHRTVALLARVGAQIAARAGRVPNEIAALAAVEEPGTAVATERHAFALISPAALRLLDGPRSPLRQPVPGPEHRLPDPEHSRAVVLFAPSDPYGPLDRDEHIAHDDLDLLLAALADQALIGLDQHRVWIGEDSPQGFLAGLRAAAEEVRDTLVVYAGGEVSADPAGEPVLHLARGSVRWPDLLDLVAGSRAANRVLVLDGWLGFGRPVPAEPAGLGAPVHQLIGLRTHGGRSLASRLHELLRAGEPGGRTELTARHLLRAVKAQAEPDHLIWARSPGDSFPLVRNAALASPPPQPVSTPYFYLSHERAPGDGELVRRLFEDLCEAVYEATYLPSPEAAGHLGAAAGSPAATAALAGCRVFVPLYAPGYFQQECCGKEWSAFGRRPRGAGWSSGVVPVLWEPVRPHELPEVAGQLLYADSNAERYAREGLLALAADPARRGDYEFAVHRLAARIVDVAEQARIPVGPVLSWTDLPNAFVGP